MFIETELTPNPETQKFLPGQAVLPTGSMTFETDEEAAVSPLATALLAVEGVKSIFLGADFIAVTKEEAEDWIDLKPLVLSSIMQFFTTGQPVIEGSIEVAGGMEDNPEDAEIILQIKDLLDQKIRPAVAQDGGDILYHGFQEGVVYLKMQGACSGCPSATITLKQGVENLLKYYIPEIVDVQAI
ncbi:NifU family protein [Temperatibacter marinus]